MWLARFGSGRVPRANPGRDGRTCVCGRELGRDDAGGCAGSTVADSVATLTPREPSSTGETLAPLLHEDMVSWDALRERYRSLLGLVHLMIGVVPNCDPYLEIWPPAFRTYNLIVPNFFNVPFSVFGMSAAPADVVGLSMYVSSRTAECPYCSAHSCSFALRRGASPETVANALVADGAPFSRGELAAIAVARSLARVPCELTDGERDELVSVYGEKGAEWVALGAVMMGFLNKFMDTIGVELEQSVVAEVGTTLGGDWSPRKAGAALDPAARKKPPPPADGVRTKLRLVPLMPAAARLDARWQKGVPSAWPAVGRFLHERTGHDFSVLSRVRHGRVVRSIASALRENLDPTSTVIGLDVKVLAGVVFAEIVGDDSLAGDVRALAARNAVSEAQIADALRFARTPGDGPPDADGRLRSALVLSRAASPSPARIDAETVAACHDGELSPAAIVELVCWLSVLQMLHRLSCFYPARD